MNQRSDTDRVLRHWLADGPSTMPDRVVDVIADRISRQPQRRTWRLTRRLTVTPAIKYGLAAAAVLVIAVVGYNLLPGRPGIGGPNATPTPAPTASAKPSASPIACDDNTSGCAGPLAAGPGHSNAFHPVLDFTVPAGWENPLDTASTYTLHDNFTVAHFFQLVSNSAIPAVQDATCTAARRAGAGTTVADWVTFLTTNPGLEASTPRAISVHGNAGMQVDVHIAATWTATCPQSVGPAVTLMVYPGTARDRVRWIDNQQATLRIIDVAGETVIIYLESSPSASDLAALNTRFDPFIATWSFAPS